MRTKARGFIVAAMVALSVPVLFSMTGKQKKICVRHNGHNICIAEPAAKAHLREHPKDENLGPCE